MSDTGLTEALRHPPSTAALCNALEAEGYLGQVMDGVGPCGGRVRFGAVAHTARLIPTRPGLAERLGAPPFRSLLGTVAPGELLVVEAQRRRDGALIGDLMATWMSARGVTGLVTDGAVRDAEALAGIGLVVQAGGVTPASGSLRAIVADTQCPVTCAGVTVLPGDVIVGDADATIVLPRDRAAALLAAAGEREAYEEYVLERLRSGDSPDGLMPPTPTARARWAAERERDTPSTAGAA